MKRSAAVGNNDATRPDPTRIGSEYQVESRSRHFFTANTLYSSGNELTYIRVYLYAILHTAIAARLTAQLIIITDRNNRFSLVFPLLKSLDKIAFILIHNKYNICIDS